MRHDGVTARRKGIADNPLSLKAVINYYQNKKEINKISNCNLLHAITHLIRGLLFLLW